MTSTVYYYPTLIVEKVQQSYASAKFYQFYAVALILERVIECFNTLVSDETGSRHLPSIMWLSVKTSRIFENDLFQELFEECRASAPGKPLSQNIKAKLERLSIEARTKLVRREKDGCPPIFVAARKGNVDVVKYLINDCNADIEQRGRYESTDDQSVHQVSPLWVAAVAGRLDMVKLLVQSGADINSTSNTGSTPLRSACFLCTEDQQSSSQHFEIVKYLVENNANISRPNQNGGTCLINSVQSVQLIKYLLDNGASIDSCDMQSKSALHYAIQEGRLEATKLFLKSGANPYLRTNFDDDALQICCLKAFTEIFEYLISNVSYSKERIAEAHELIGCSLLDEYFDIARVTYHWKTAIDIRNHDPDDPIKKRGVDHDIVLDRYRHRAYQGCQEFTTAQQLDRLDLDDLRIQCLLVRERILGPLHKETIQRLMYRGTAYINSMQPRRCIDLWIYACKLRLKKDTMFHVDAALSLQSLVKLFLDFFVNAPPNEVTELTFEDVIDVIDLITSQLKISMELLKIKPVHSKHEEIFDLMLTILMHLIYIIQIMPDLEEDCIRTKNQMIRRLIRINPVTSHGDSLLHLAVTRIPFDNNYSTSLFFLPDIEVVKLLLSCGYNVDILNKKKLTPLQLACVHPKSNSRLIKLLLHNGAHPDRYLPPIDVNRNMIKSLSEASIKPLNYITLQCLAARKIVEYNIPTGKELPKCLQDLIDIH